MYMYVSDLKNKSLNLSTPTDFPPSTISHPAASSLPEMEMEMGEQLRDQLPAGTNKQFP